MKRAPAHSLSRAERRGLRAGILLHAGFVTTFTAVCTFQIVKQVWFPEVPEAKQECRAGIQTLLSTLRSARESAINHNPEGELSALEAFRQAVEPHWSQQRALLRSCEGDATATEALREIDRLRYAEEHALRYETMDLARRRMRVRALEEQLAGSSSRAPDPASRD